jgi:hypothetical protein
MEKSNSFPICTLQWLKTYFSRGFTYIIFPLLAIFCIQRIQFSTKHFDIGLYHLGSFGPNTICIERFKRRDLDVGLLVLSVSEVYSLPKTIQIYPHSDHSCA